MSETGQALRIHKTEAGSQARIEPWSPPGPKPGEVVIDVAFSSLNYKDALAVTGAGKILRHFPLNAGIDAAGAVRDSQADGLAVGDAVVVTGYGLSESRDGGLASTVCVPGALVVPLPDGLTARQAMAYGTAGFTAGLTVSRLLDNGQQPDLGPVAVTGATGGVGSHAIAILAQLGYTVHAVTRKADAADYLRSLGAAEVIAPDAIESSGRPLESARFGAVVDNVGGELLARLLPMVAEYGNVASIGLAGGVKLETTVLPLILRGVSLIGIHSVECPMDRRRLVWAHLAGDWKHGHLDAIASREIPLEQAPEACQAMIDGTSRGRTLVRLAG